MNLRGKIVYTTSMLVILVEAPVLSHLGIKSFFSYNGSCVIYISVWGVTGLLYPRSIGVVQ